jgi:hypothetical protein
MVMKNPILWDIAGRKHGVQSWEASAVVHKNCLPTQIGGSIPDKVISILNWPNPSSRTMAQGSTQPLTEMSTRNLPEG